MLLAEREKNNIVFRTHTICIANVLKLESVQCTYYTCRCTRKGAQHD